MKKIKKLGLFLIVFVAFLLQSCSNSEESSFLDENKASMLKIDNVVRIQNFEEQKIAFNLLSEKEKYMLWEQKINRLISNKNFNKNQINLINGILNKFNPSVYSKTSNDYDDYFTNIVAKKFVKDAKKYFTDTEIYDYFFTISGGFVSRISGGGGSTSCNCNNAIVGGFDCAGFDLMHCVQQNVTCVDNTTNCGVFNTSPCDGICKSII